MDRESTNALHERGVRVTPQRAYIWRVLSEGHFTAEEVWERIKGGLKRGRIVLRVSMGEQAEEE